MERSDEDAVLHGDDGRRLHRRHRQLARVAVRGSAKRRHRGGGVRRLLRRRRRDGDGEDDVRVGLRPRAPRRGAGEVAAMVRGHAVLGLHARRALRWCRTPTSGSCRATWRPCTRRWWAPRTARTSGSSAAASFVGAFADQGLLDEILLGMQPVFLGRRRAAPPAAADVEAGPARVGPAGRAAGAAHLLACGRPSAQAGRSSPLSRVNGTPGLPGGRPSAMRRRAHAELAALERRDDRPAPSGRDRGRGGDGARRRRVATSSHAQSSVQRKRMSRLP